MDWQALLSSGEIEIEGRLPWSSNYSFLAVVTLQGEEGRAVYKPGEGERPLRDFGPGLYRREVAAFELSVALGLDLVPETVVRADGPLGAGSLQRFVDASFEEHYFTLLEQPGHHARLRELAAFDVVANNADRKGGHVLVDSSESIWAIDNGLCFHESEKLRTVIWDFAGERVPDRVLGACRQIVDCGAPERVAAMIAPRECEALRLRAAALLESKRLPAPRDDYRSYPWPLV